VALGLLLGAVLGMIVAFVGDYIARSRRTEADIYAEFAALRREALLDVLRPWRPFARIIRRRRE
jgi:hypothetical protein